MIISYHALVRIIGRRYVLSAINFKSWSQLFEYNCKLDACTSELDLSLCIGNKNQCCLTLEYRLRMYVVAAETRPSRVITLCISLS